MPAPHELTSLAAGGEDGLLLARAKLGALLAAHGGSIPAVAEALGVHRVTVHGWIAAWGVRVPAAAAAAAPKKKRTAKKSAKAKR